MPNDKKIAVLIDAENVSSKYIKIIMDEAAKYGQVTYRRIYADWTKTIMTSWKATLLEFSLTPMQQFSYTTGKNSTDSAMIIDAMDILYTGRVDGFCLITSDSDFTRLAARLREAGMTVVGMGEAKASKSFVAACQNFAFLDVIAEKIEAEKARRAAEKAKAEAEARAEDLAKEKAAAEEEAERQAGFLGIKGKLARLKEKLTRKKKGKAEKEPKKFPKAKSQSASPAPADQPAAVVHPEKKKSAKQATFSEVEKAARVIVRENVDEEGWVTVSRVGQLLLEKYPGFNVKDYGYAKLRTFLNSTGAYKLKAVRHGKTYCEYYIKLK